MTHYDVVALGGGPGGYVAAHDEWQVADKRYLSETSLALLGNGDPNTENLAPTAALTA